MTVTYNLNVGAIVDTGPAVPASVSSDGRYIKDQNGDPYLLLSDQLLPALHNGTLANVNTVMADRQSRGFNALWISLINDAYIGANDNYTDNAGNLPFTSGDFTHPIEAYWTRVDSLVASAYSYGITCCFCPIETAGAAMDLARSNGNTGCNTYGQFLGNRYKNSPNILWMHGNDFGGMGWVHVGWSASSQTDTLMENIVAGIKSAGDTHLQTCELNV